MFRRSAVLTCSILTLVGCTESNANNSTETTVDGGTDAVGSPNSSTSDAGDDAVSGPQEVRLNGAVNKGPFVLGSTVNVSLLDSVTFQGTGDVFITNTISDLGEFTVDFTVPSQGTFASLQGTGFYYNEVTGNLSNAQITLRAFYKIASGGTQQAYINLITHLTSGRIQTLLGDPSSIKPEYQTGDDFQDAIAQAESELRLELAIGPTNFEPNAQGTQMNILGDSTDVANAYLFAVSAVLAKAAEIRAMGASIDSALQELVNSIAIDIADNGVIDNVGLTDTVQLAEAELDPQDVTEKLISRLASLGQTTPVPDINAVLDSNNDGVANKDDGFPCGDGVAHPDRFCFELLAGSNIMGDSSDDHLADFDGDGNLDYASNSGGLRIFFGDGTGNLRANPPVTVPITEQGMSFSLRHSKYADLDGDSIGDMVGVTDDRVVFLSGNASKTAPFDAAQFAGDGLGVTYGPLDVGDLDADGDLDVVVLQGPSATTSPGQFRELAVFLNDGSGNLGTAGAPSSTVTLATGDDFSREVALADLIGSPNVDLVYGINAVVTDPNSSRLENRGATILMGNGDGTFSISSQTVTLGLPNDFAVDRVTPADVDGDGDNDLVASAMPYADVQLNDGGTFTPNTVVPDSTTEQFSSGASVVDLNGDGSLELIGSIFERGMIVYLGSATGYDGSDWSVLFEPSEEDFEDPTSLGSEVFIGDLDNDGDDDLVTNGVVFLRNP